MALITLSASWPAAAATWQSFQHNRQGVKEFAKKSYFPAHKEFMKALESDPLNAEVQMNLGLTFEANEEFEKAEKSYRGVLHLVTPGSEAEFMARFNLAQVLAKQKKIDEALQTYQACLELRPDSIEVKTNIELLWQGGQGGGKGESKNKDEKNQQGQNRDQQKDQSPQDNKDKKQPKPFDSRELSKDDVKRILDEIKNQEQGIRAQEYDKSAKEAPRGKDW